MIKPMTMTLFFVYVFLQAGGIPDYFVVNLINFETANNVWVLLSTDTKTR